jgi:hypothetical protein
MDQHQQRFNPHLLMFPHPLTPQKNPQTPLKTLKIAPNSSSKDQSQSPRLQSSLKIGQLQHPQQIPIAIRRGQNATDPRRQPQQARNGLQSPAPFPLRPQLTKLSQKSPPQALASQLSSPLHIEHGRKAITKETQRTDLELPGGRED